MPIKVNSKEVNYIIFVLGFKFVRIVYTHTNIIIDLNLKILNAIFCTQ